MSLTTTTYIFENLGGDELYHSPNLNVDGAARRESRAVRNHDFLFPLNVSHGEALRNAMPLCNQPRPESARPVAFEPENCCSRRNTFLVWVGEHLIPRPTKEYGTPGGIRTSDLLLRSLAQ
jgi:hypothetical protein